MSTDTEPMCRCGHCADARDGEGCGIASCPCVKYVRQVQIAGVGPDAPVVYNEKGAGQSHSPYRFDLLPPLACADISAILSHGAAKYGEGSYLNIEAKDHLNHAMQHIFAYQAGDTQEGPTIEHAKHAACRMLFWLECLERA